jgi:hypothetical protein
MLVVRMYEIGDVMVAMIRREGMNFLVSFFSSFFFLHTLLFYFSSSLVFLNTRSLKLKLRCD